MALADRLRVAVLSFLSKIFPFKVAHLARKDSHGTRPVVGGDELVSSSGSQFISQTSSQLVSEQLDSWSAYQFVS